MAIQTYPCLSRREATASVDIGPELTWEGLQGLLGIEFSESNKHPFNKIDLDSLELIAGKYNEDACLSFPLEAVLWGEDEFGRKFVDCSLLWWSSEDPYSQQAESFVLYQKDPNENVWVGHGQNVPNEWKGPLLKVEGNLERFLRGEGIEFVENDTRYNCLLTSHARKQSLAALMSAMGTRPELIESSIFGNKGDIPSSQC